MEYAIGNFGLQCGFADGNFEPVRCSRILDSPISIGHFCRLLLVRPQQQHEEHTQPMKDRIINGIFSLSGASLAIGTAGFLSAIVTMFVDVADKVPIRLLLFSILIFTCLIVVLLKVIYDLSSERRPVPPFEHPIKFIPDEKLFIIRRNENFLNNIIVGCYSHQDDVDRLAYVAVVHLVQDKVIQIKIYSDLGLLGSVPCTTSELQALIIRPVVPVTALQQYTNQENSNER